MASPHRLWGTLSLGRKGLNSVRSGRHKAAEAPSDGGGGGVGHRHIGELDRGREEMGAGGLECACNTLLRPPPRSWWASGYTSGTHRLQWPSSAHCFVRHVSSVDTFSLCSWRPEPRPRSVGGERFVHCACWEKEGVQGKLLPIACCCARSGSFPNQLGVHLLLLAPCASVSV